MRLQEVFVKKCFCLHRNAGAGVGVNVTFHIKFMLLVLVDQLKFTFLSFRFPASVSKFADPNEK